MLKPRTLRTRIAIVTLAAGWLLTPSPVWACGCSPTADWSFERQVTEEFNWADRVFAGTVVRNDDRSVALRVDATWKGGDSEVIVVDQGFISEDGGTAINTCDFAFRPGARYVVFAHRSDRGLTASQCGHTGQWALASRVVELLEALAPRREP
jgi:hypothetical protein